MWRGLVDWLCGAIILAVLMDAGMTRAHAQEKLEADYTATLLGLPIGNITWTVELQEKNFISAASGHTSGVLRLFAGGHGTVSSRGPVSAGQPVASNFALNLVAGRWSDDIQITYSGGKAHEHFADPPLPNPQAVPLTDAHRKGTVDPMTALLIRMPGNGALAVPQACERTVAVFDGHTRYDLQFAFKRMETVKAAKGYQGSVVVCSIHFAPIAGYDPGRFLITYLAAQKDMEIWLAPVEGTRLMVPYRMSMPTPMGFGILQATRFEAAPVRSLATNVN